nr:probable alkaline/neutral invertase D [Tanacetum cinerariifolium]
MDNFELTKILDRPRRTIKRAKSFDERSLSDMSISRGLDNLDIAYSPDGWSRSMRSDEWKLSEIKSNKRVRQTITEPKTHYQCMLVTK